MTIVQTFDVVTKYGAAHAIGRALRGNRRIIVVREHSSIEQSSVALNPGEFLMASTRWRHSPPLPTDITHAIYPGGVTDALAAYIRVSDWYHNGNGNGEVQALDDEQALFVDFTLRVRQKMTPEEEQALLIEAHQKLWRLRGAVDKKKRRAYERAIEALNGVDRRGRKNCGASAAKMVGGRNRLLERLETALKIIAPTVFADVRALDLAEDQVGRQLDRVVAWGERWKAWLSQHDTGVFNVSERVDHFVEKLVQVNKVLREIDVRPYCQLARECAEVLIDDSLSGVFSWLAGVLPKVQCLYLKHLIFREDLKIVLHLKSKGSQNLPPLADTLVPVLQRVVDLGDEGPLKHAQEANYLLLEDKETPRERLPRKLHDELKQIIQW